MKYLVIIAHSWEKFEIKEREKFHKVANRTDRDYMVLCIVHPKKEALKNLIDYVSKNVFEKLRPNAAKENTTILYHDPEDIWTGSIDNFYEWIKNHSILFDEFSGGTHWVYNEIINKLGDWGTLNANELPGWEAIKKKFCLKYIESIGNSLFPLHLALQSFFAVSKVEKNEWKTLPDDLPGNAKENYRQLFSKEYREKAFLLVNEAHYDYFAEIGSRLGPFDNSAQNEAIDEQPLLNLIEELFGDEKILSCGDFKDEENHRIDGAALKEKVKNIISDKKNTLKTLCAILANISDDGLNSKLPDGKPGIQKHRIGKSKKLLRTRPGCREWFEKPPHTKWPKDIDGYGDIPDDSYANLVEQLIEWNHSGDTAKTVIDMIESLAFYLERIIIYFEEEAG
jgi:hypothetical protein